MSQFINYQKRGFALPSGCKDLIDVLEPSKRRTKSHGITGTFQSPQFREEHFPAAGLSQIERYVSMLLQSRGQFFVLNIAVRDEQFPVVLYRIKSEKTIAMVLVVKDTHREQAIRAFFDHQAIQPLMDDVFPDVSTGSVAHGLSYPLPSDTSNITSLTKDLLRRVYGLSEETGVDYRYCDVATGF